MLRTLARRQLLLRGAARSGVAAHAAAQPQAAAAPSGSRLPPHVAPLHTAMRPSAPLAKKAGGSRRSRQPQEEEEMEEELDDLFGGVSSADAAAEQAPAASQPSSGAFSITEKLSHAEAFAKHVQEFRTAMAQWSERGASPPSLAPFGKALHVARSGEDFALLFELWAECRALRLQPLPQEKYNALALQALKRRCPEVVLSRILNGDESELYHPNWLRAIQSGLLRKLLEGEPAQLAASAALPGAPQRSPEWLAQLQAVGQLKVAATRASEEEIEAAAAEQSEPNFSQQSDRRSVYHIERATHQVVLIDRMLQCAALKPVDGRHDWYLLAAALTACSSRVRRIGVFPLADEVAELLRLLRLALADADKKAGRTIEKRDMRRSNAETRIPAVVKEHLPQEDVQDVVSALHTLLSAAAPEK